MVCMENKHSSIVIRITATLGKCREGNNAKAKCYFPANTSNEGRKRTLMSATTTPFFTFFLSAGVVGILPSENRLPVTMGDFINLSLLSHT